LVLSSDTHNKAGGFLKKFITLMALVAISTSSLARYPGTPASAQAIHPEAPYLEMVDRRWDDKNGAILNQLQCSSHFTKERYENRSH
jgi:hypothetical protein